MAKDWKGFDPKNPTASDLIPFAGVIYFSYTFGLFFHFLESFLR
ncbi:hypothetical protein LEP1GSC067_1195 [Leptospira interrogans serovar Lora str. TE 1992]|uniref:Uncharacterized protein n=1 Tax=Leptospira interrogans serovar Lora str. TE 1992 TaxID=1193028 RepID=M3F030_LEPIR|nr:hypothetical protein LEP1GSC067_1195 [Leptospira interrogans serovar Lora str. TE 1992]